MLFSYGDISKIKYFINQINIDSEKKIAETHLNAMVKFAESNICRRVPLINYFGESYTENNCGMCDNCTSTIEDQTDITIQSQKFLSCVARSGQYFGTNYIIDILRGSKAEKILKLKHNELSTYDIGSEFSKDQWTLTANELIRQGYIERDEHGVLKLHKNAWKVFRNEVKVYCSGIEEKTLEVNKYTTDSDHDKTLYEKLRYIRKELADSKGIPPFAIFSNKTLIDICKKFPMSLESFRRIYGIGTVKAENYAFNFIPAIQKYCEENGIEEIKASIGRKKSKKTHKKSSRTSDIAATFNETGNIDLTADHFNIQPATVIDHLHKYVKKGHKLENRNQLLDYVELDEATVKTVLYLFEELGCEYLKPVLDEFDSDELTYDDLKILRLAFLC